MASPLWKLGRSTLASAVLVALVAALAMAYTSGGGASRESLIGEMLSNFILVLGMQVFIGNTGVLSFGHMAFAQIASYATAVVAIPLAAKTKALPDIPFGLESVHFGPLGATLFAVAVTMVVGAVFGVAVCRASGLAPTMITLAGLFVVDQVVKNWQELTRGAGGLSGVPRLEGNGWLWVGAFIALVIAHLFQETRIGRFSIATREDELAAPALGIRLFTSRYAAWVLSVGLIALGGSLRAQSLGSVVADAHGRYQFPPWVPGTYFLQSSAGAQCQLYRWLPCTQPPVSGTPVVLAAPGDAYTADFDLFIDNLHHAGFETE